MARSAVIGCGVYMLNIEALIFLKKRWVLTIDWRNKVSFES